MIGDIYKITCTTSGKCYVGQAKKHFGRDDDKWGYIKRWKSHIYEATSDKKDHCTVLNNAIRKYGKEDFNVELLCECETKEDMDDKERYYIEHFNSLVPNGYNLEKGGRTNRVFSKETRNKMSESGKNKVVPEYVKKNWGKWQIGNRRNKMKRKHPEDNELPKYITAIRKNGKILSYNICGFPIGIEEKKYISKTFTIGKYNDRKYVLQEAINYLNELKKKYNGLYEKIDVYKKNLKKDYPQYPKKTEKPLAELPEFIFPLHNKQRIKLGYYVDGVLKNDGSRYPRKEFASKKANMWDLNDAKKYIEQCKIQNEDETFKIPDNIKCGNYRKSSNELEHQLPKYMVIQRTKDNKIKGFAFKLCNVENGKGIARSFTHPRQTLKDKFNACYEELQKTKEKYKIQDSDEPQLPRHILPVKKKGQHIGYKFVLRSIKKENGCKLQRFFTNPKYTMKDRLQKCIEELTETKKQYGIN